MLTRLTLPKRIYLFICLLLFFSCGPTEQDLREQAEHARLEKTRASIATMVSRHKASADWYKQVDGRLFALSIDIQQAVASRTGQNVLVFGTLQDVYLKGGQAYLLVKNASSAAEVFFVLQAPEDLLRSITSLESPRYSDFAFVVRPFSTSLPLLRAFTEFEREDIIIESADAVVVSGELVDFLDLEGASEEQLAP